MSTLPTHPVGEVEPQREHLCCWGVPFQTKVSQGFYEMLPPAFLGSCPYPNSVQDRGRTEVSAQILDSVKEVRERLGEKTRWSESLMSVWELGGDERALRRDFLLPVPLGPLTWLLIPGGAVQVGKRTSAGDRGAVH